MADQEGYNRALEVFDVCDSAGSILHHRFSFERELGLAAGLCDLSSISSVRSIGVNLDNDLFPGHLDISWRRRVRGEQLGVVGHGVRGYGISLDL